MKWADLDLTEARWTMQEVSGHSEFVFPAFHTPKRPMSENTVYQALKKLGYGGLMTAHGFRSKASSLLNESMLWHPDVIEQALAHQVGSAIRSTYNHTTYWKDRAAMMQW